MTTLLGTYSIESLRRRGLLRGAASAFDLRGATYRQYRHGGDPAAADAAAIRDDFAAVGADLRAAMDWYDEVVL